MGVILLVGRKGNLSLSVQKLFMDEEIVIVGSDIAFRWCSEEGLSNVESDLRKLGTKPKLVINASGLVDPNQSYDRLLAVNYFLPRNLEEYSADEGIKLVTFGSILENFADISATNAYLSTKRKYFEHLKSKPLNISNFLHLQIHTWYGTSKLHQHMFLSQVFNSVKNRTPLRMTSGEQIREYHHIEDDLKALMLLLDQGDCGIVQVNHGESVRLREIATSILISYDLLDLLKMGEIASPKSENFKNKFEKSSQLINLNFRDTINGVKEYFDQLLEGYK